MDDFVTKENIVDCIMAILSSEFNIEEHQTYISTKLDDIHSYEVEDEIDLVDMVDYIVDIVHAYIEINKDLNFVKHKLKSLLRDYNKIYFTNIIKTKMLLDSDGLNVEYEDKYGKTYNLVDLEDSILINILKSKGYKIYKEE